MKRSIRLCVAIAAAGVLSAGCAAPGGVTNSADSSSSTGSGNTGSTTPSAASSSSAPAKVGDAITLKGNADGSQTKVVVRKVVDPTTSTDGFSQPAAGARYVAVQFEITNTGTVAYDDSPSNGAKVVDPDGQQFTSTIVTGIKAGPLLPSDVKLPPGRRALGYVVFEVPKASKVSGVQFGMDSGFAETGEWLIK